MEKINFIIAKNLTELRKKNKLTQMELAEKLNYSDKAVSKWEKGESFPGIEVFYKISKLYNVSLDYIIGESTAKPQKITTAKIRKNRSIITLLSIIAVWLTAYVLYVFPNILGNYKPWILFCWACPASLVVALVFDIIWHNKRFMFIFMSALMWTVLICFCLQFINYNIWMILGIGVPLQIAVLLWARLVK